MDLLSTANTKFCLDFFKALKTENTNKNIFFSPLSISAALGMVLLGARGNTAKQIKEVFHFHDVSSTATPGTGKTSQDGSAKCEAEGVHHQFQALLSAIYKPNSDYSLSIANRLYAEITFAFCKATLDFIMGSLSKSVAEFCLDLFHEVNKTNPKKNIFSPMSISAALATVFLGAKGNTAAQMEKPSPSQCRMVGGIPREYHTLFSKLKKLDTSYVLSLANALFLQIDFPFQKNYIDYTKELYGAIPQTADFKNATEAVRQKINSWVESQTQGKIKELFVPGIITTITVLVLVTAIYFKGNWKYKFDKTKTVKRDFRLNQIERTTAEKLALWTSSESPMERKVEVYLPGFKLEDIFNLKSSLKEMGMTDVFAELTTNLSAIPEIKSLNMSEAVHKAYVEVNEEGTEAGAAT